MAKPLPFEGLPILDMLNKQGVSPFKDNHADWSALYDYLVKMERATRLPLLSLPWHFYAIDRKKRVPLSLSDKGVINERSVSHFKKVVEAKKEISKKYLDIMIPSYLANVKQQILAAFNSKVACAGNINIPSTIASCRLQIDRYIRRIRDVKGYAEQIDAHICALNNTPYTVFTKDISLSDGASDSHWRDIFIHLKQIAYLQREMGSATCSMDGYLENAKVHGKQIQEARAYVMPNSDAFMARAQYEIDHILQEIKNALDNPSFPYELMEVKFGGYSNRLALFKFASCNEVICANNHVASSVNSHVNVGKLFFTVQLHISDGVEYKDKSDYNIIKLEACSGGAGNNLSERKDRLCTTHPFINGESICFGDAHDTVVQHEYKQQLDKIIEIWNVISTTFTEGATPYKSIHALKGYRYRVFSQAYKEAFENRHYILSCGLPQEEVSTGVPF